MPGGGGGGGDPNTKRRGGLGGGVKKALLLPLRVFSLKRSTAGAFAVSFRVLCRNKI